MPVEGPAFAIEIDELGVRLDGVGDVGGEQRVAVLSGELDGRPAGGAAVPDRDRLLQRSWPGLRVGERRPELPLPGDPGFAPEPPEQLVALPLAFPLVL